MARARSAESPRTRSKAAAIEEITQGIDTFRKILTSIEDFSREGFPYRDGARAKAELQIRETVRRLFGERSPEFQAHRTHKLKISTPTETAQSVLLVKSLIAALENKKLELQGLAPSTPAPETAQTDTATPPPQMTLVPPASPSAQITMNQATPGTTPPATMSVAITTNLSQPTGSVPPTPTWAPAQGPESPTPVQPTAPVIPANHLESTRIRATSTELPAIPTAPPLEAVRTAIEMTPPTARLAPMTPAAIPPAPPQLATLPETAVGALTSPTEPLKPVIPPASLDQPQQHLEPPSPSVLPVAQPTPAPAAAPIVASSNQIQPDPLDLLRKVCLRFHAVARQLRLRKDYRTTLEVEDDYDLQDLLCALLKLEFDEIGSDEWTPPYTGGSTRTTLLLNSDHVAVVAKKTRSGLTTKELAEQITADASHYAARKSCKHLFCFIYDPEGRIGSPTRLESDLTSVSDRYTIHVLIAPK